MRDRCSRKDFSPEIRDGGRKLNTQESGRGRRSNLWKQLPLREIFRSFCAHFFLSFLCRPSLKVCCRPITFSLLSPFISSCLPFFCCCVLLCQPVFPLLHLLYFLLVTQTKRKDSALPRRSITSSNPATNCSTQRTFNSGCQIWRSGTGKVHIWIYMSKCTVSYGVIEIQDSCYCCLFIVFFFHLFFAILVHFTKLSKVKKHWQWTIVTI